MFFICRYQDLVVKPVQIHRLPGSDGQPESIILVLYNNKVLAYNNQCPHAWVPLDTASPDILSGCKQFIQCSSHFAQFRMQDGYCLYGPCEGQSLQPRSVILEEDNIFLQQDP